MLLLDWAVPWERFPDSLLAEPYPLQLSLIFPFKFFLSMRWDVFLWGFSSNLWPFIGSPSPAIRSFLTTGFLGGFTTFSAFALEFGLLVDKDLHAHAIFYALSSVMVSILCFFMGIRLVRFIAV